MARPKIALIGGGNIGGVLAEQIAYRELGELAGISDIPPRRGRDLPAAVQAYFGLRRAK